MDSLSFFHLSSALIWVAAILTTGGIVLFRPLVKHLGEYLDALAEGAQHGYPQLDEARLMGLLENMEARLAQLEEGSTEHRRLASPGGAATEDASPHDPPLGETPPSHDLAPR